MSNKIMDSSAGNLSSINDHHFSYTPLINGLPDEIVLSCLARFPRKYHTVLKCVSKRWRDLICSNEWREYRQKNGLDETWIYALCRDTNKGQLCCRMLDPRQGCWKSIPGFPSCCVMRKGMGFEVIGHQLYLLGGCSWSSEEILDEVYCYDVSANAWTEVASMPAARCYFGCNAVDGKIYALGGAGLKPSIRLSWDTYNPCSNTWDSHPYPDIITDVEYSIVIDGLIYIRSCNSRPPVKVYTYDPSSGSRQRADTDMAREWYGPAVFVENYLYLLDDREGLKLKRWVKDTREWVTLCKVSPIVIRPPYQMVAMGKDIFIVGEGLRVVVVDVGDISDIGVVASFLPTCSRDTDNYHVIGCKCVSI